MKKSLKVVIGVWILSFLLASPTLIGIVDMVEEFHSESVEIQKNLASQWTSLKDFLITGQAT